MAERLKCAVCGREYQDSVIGMCPKRPGTAVCMYCCRKCKSNYTVPGFSGQRCRERDKAREAKKEKT